jgi:hypothetical protein
MTSGVRSGGDIVPQVYKLLAGPNFATLSLVIDGRLRSYVMWIAAVDGDLVVVSPSGSPKTRALVTGASATVLIWRHDHPYDYVEMRCRVRAAVAGEPARAMVEQTLAARYRGSPYPRPDIAEWTMVHLRPEYTRVW